jgi:hypothetical protein
MANRPINITGSNTSTGDLTLSDNGNTSANPGDTVTWNIGPNCGVSSISGINDDISSTNVFEPDPARMPGNNTSWQGTVNPDIDEDTTENYTIVWYDTSGGGPHSYDPLIQVNPNK